MPKAGQNPKRKKPHLEFSGPGLTTEAEADSDVAPIKLLNDMSTQTDVEGWLHFSDAILSVSIALKLRSI